VPTGWQQGTREARGVRGLMVRRKFIDDPHTMEQISMLLDAVGS
jgi:hypothetical protein